MSAGFIGQLPTGDKDPFALRRQANGDTYYAKVRIFPGGVVGLSFSRIRNSVQTLDMKSDLTRTTQGFVDPADNDTLLAAYIFEALRFDPINPIIYRRAVRDTILARSESRAVVLAVSARSEVRIAFDSK